MSRSKTNKAPTRTFSSVLDEVDVPSKHLDRARSIWNRTKDVDAVKKFVSSVKEETELDERNQANAMKRKVMDASRGARYKLAGNKVPERDAEHKNAQAHNKAIGRALRNEESEVEESNNNPYVKPHIEKGNTQQSGWKASNKHGRVKYFGMDFKKSAEKHAGISEEIDLDEVCDCSDCVEKERQGVVNVARTTTKKSVLGKHGEIKKKIIETQVGNVELDPAKRLVGTDSLVKAYKKATPGQSLDESFNIAFASGVGVTLTASDLGMKTQGGFQLHPSVIAEMEERNAALEEDAVSALKKPVYMPPRRRKDGSFGPAKTVMRKTGKKIIDNPEIDSADSDPHDGQ
jgi:hypothetical protein